MEAKVLVAAKALCLVGFPLIPMLVYLSRVHPALPGNSAAEEVAALAAQAARWSQVHAAFWVAGLLGLATVLIVRTEVAKQAPVLPTNAAAALGVVGAVIFTGTVYMEILVIPGLSTACSESPVCLGPENAVFTNALANEGWRVLPGLTLGGRTLVLGLAFLAILGFSYGALKSWESAALFGGSVLEFGANTGLHAWGNFTPGRGMPGLAAVAILLAGGSIAVRMVIGLRVGEKPEPEVHPTPPAEGVTPPPEPV